MHESEAEELVDCFECGATISVGRDRGFAIGPERALCFECARRRGGQFDELRDEWAAVPETADLPERGET